METHYALPPADVYSAADAYAQEDLLPEVHQAAETGSAAQEERAVASTAQDKLAARWQAVGADIIDRADLISQLPERGYAEAVGYDERTDVVDYATPYPTGTRLQVVVERLDHDSSWQKQGVISGTTMASLSSSEALPAGSVRLMPDVPLPSNVEPHYRTMHPRVVGVETEPFWHDLDAANKALFRRVVSVEGIDRTSGLTS